MSPSSPSITDPSATPPPAHVLTHTQHSASASSSSSSPCQPSHALCQLPPVDSVLPPSLPAAPSLASSSSSPAAHSNAQNQLAASPVLRPIPFNAKHVLHNNNPSFNVVRPSPQFPHPHLNPSAAISALPPPSLHPHADAALLHLWRPPPSNTLANNVLSPPSSSRPLEGVGLASSLSPAAPLMAPMHFPHTPFVPQHAYSFHNNQQNTQIAFNHIMHYTYNTAASPHHYVPPSSSSVYYGPPPSVQPYPPTPPLYAPAHAHTHTHTHTHAQLYQTEQQFQQQASMYSMQYHGSHPNLLNFNPSHSLVSPADLRSSSDNVYHHFHSYNPSHLPHTHAALPTPSAPVPTSATLPRASSRRLTPTSSAVLSSSAPASTSSAANTSSQNIANTQNKQKSIKLSKPPKAEPTKVSNDVDESDVEEGDASLDVDDPVDDDDDDEMADADLEADEDQLPKPKDQQSVIHCGIVAANGERQYNMYSPYFGLEVDVYTALNDPSQRTLYRASALAHKFNIATNQVGMYLVRRRSADYVTGLYQAVRFVHKPVGRTGLKAGGYFVSIEVCKEFEEYVKSHANHGRNKARANKKRGSQTQAFTINTHQQEAEQAKAPASVNPSSHSASPSTSSAPSLISRQSNTPSQQEQEQIAVQALMQGSSPSSTPPPSTTTLLANRAALPHYSPPPSLFSATISSSVSSLNRAKKRRTMSANSTSMFDEICKDTQAKMQADAQLIRNMNAADQPQEAIAASNSEEVSTESRAVDSISTLSIEISNSNESSLHDEISVLSSQPSQVSRPSSLFNFSSASNFSSGVTSLNTSQTNSLASTPSHRSTTSNRNRHTLPPPKTGVPQFPFLMRHESPSLSTSTLSSTSSPGSPSVVHRNTFKRESSFSSVSTSLSSSSGSTSTSAINTPRYHPDLSIGVNNSPFPFSSNPLSPRGVNPLSPRSSNFEPASPTNCMSPRGTIAELRRNRSIPIRRGSNAGAIASESHDSNKQEVLINLGSVDPKLFASNPLSPTATTTAFSKFHVSSPIPESHARSHSRQASMTLEPAVQKIDESMEEITESNAEEITESNAE